MKRMLSLALALAMALSLTACGGGGGNSASSGDAPTPQSSAAQPSASSDTGKEVEFPELTPLEYWNCLDDFLEANAPQKLAEFFQMKDEFYAQFNSDSTEEVEVGNFKCYINRDLKLAIVGRFVGPNDFAGELVIPSEVEGCRVFFYQPGDKIPDGVTSLVVEDGVMGIEDDCTSANLTSVSLPDSLVYTWSNVFSDCPLAEIDLPDSLYVVDVGGTKLTELVVPENAIYVNGSGTSPELASVTFKGDHVLAIKGFWNCEKLTRFDFPESVQYCHPEAFTNTPITVPEEIIFRD